MFATTSSNNTSGERVKHSKHATQALAEALFVLPKVRAVGTFGVTTGSPRLILATTGMYHTEKFAQFIKDHQSKIIFGDRALVTRIATTHTFSGATSSFQKILADFEHRWCSNIGESLTVYVLPLDWPSRVTQLKKVFQPFLKKSDWDELRATARVLYPNR